MYQLKNSLFLDLTKNQKASLFSFLKSFVKKNAQTTNDEILELFIEDEQYYFEQGNPHFEWIIERFEEEKFLKELLTVIKENKKQLDIKEAQKPFLEKQKIFAKEQRKKAAEYKMSKEKPTPKQLYYYDTLCKKNGIEKKETKDLSRLDLKNMIGKIIDDAEQKKHPKTGIDTDLPDTRLY